ncbi:MAG: hypothetical protein FD149_57, partial [Rhodospirillaceae bacterium]
RPQWQIELREKFNFNIPIYDGHRLTWYDSPALRGRLEWPVDRTLWHHESIVIVSSHLMRRRRILIVLDEAHHARRKGAGSSTEGRTQRPAPADAGLEASDAGVVTAHRHPHACGPRRGLGPSRPAGDAAAR